AAAGNRSDADYSAAAAAEVIAEQLAAAALLLAAAGPLSVPVPASQQQVHRDGAVVGNSVDWLRNR
ncbi:hypothetical protein, partial [Herbaspirillum sp. 3C11]|uniref:hypothetical protein n=1 Tax=Herbaspirillum sp. 3C11 TaxID=2559615 RepID=UPI001ADCEFFF